MRRLAFSLDRADSVFATLERLAQANPLARLDTTLARADTLVRRRDAGIGTLAAPGSMTRRASSRALLTRSERLVGTIDTAVAAAGPR